MKISKKTLLIMGGIFSISSLGLMFVSAAEKILSPDLDNAIQHINEVKFVFTGTNGAEATLKFLDGNLVKIEAGSGFFISEDNQASFGLMGGEYSSVLGGYRNRKGGTYDVVLGGSGNSVRGSYNSILGGEGNSITGGSYNTIIGGIENKINSKSSLYSVILGGISNMVGSGKSSVVMGTHSSVNGSHSVALGSGSNIEANNSFLWTDGSNSDTLDSDNVFAVMAQSGVVINTDKAHSFAKLTLGGPMILFVGRTGENITCGGGVGGGILKVVESENNQMCMCSCDGNGWSSMFGKGRCMSVCDVSLEPECGDTVTKVGKNIGGRQYAVYSGSCKKGEIVEGTGAYLVTKDNKVHWSCQTEDGLVVGCSGNVNAEGGYITVKTCGGTPPTGVGVVTGSSTYVGNGNKVWEGNDNLDKNNLLPCQWTCTTGYEIDHQNGGRCKAKTRTANCEGDIPSLAEEKPGHGTYTQTWNGSTWTPPSMSWSYDAPACGYKCKTNYTWNGSSCVLGTGSCGTKPTGNGYKFGTGIYTYGYTPTSWTYTGGTLGPCLYKCDTGYIWSGGKCVLGTGSCGTKLAGSGYVFGPATYMFGYTPTSWTYTSSSIPGACQYTCEIDWELESASSKCIKTVWASCEESHFNCKGEGSTATNQQTGRDGSTIKGWTWTCQGTTGGSSQECIECNTERGYMELNGQCVSEGVSCKKLSIKTRNMTNGGSTQVTCSTVGGNAYISIHCGNGAIISGSNISELTGTCTYPKEYNQYNLVCYVRGETNNNCKGTVSNSVSYGGGGNYCKCAPNNQCEKVDENGDYGCTIIPVDNSNYSCVVQNSNGLGNSVQCKYENSNYGYNNVQWIPYYGMCDRDKATYNCNCFKDGTFFGIGVNGPVPFRLDGGDDADYVQDDKCCTCSKQGGYF